MGGWEHGFERHHTCAGAACTQVAARTQQSTDVSAGRPRRCASGPKACRCGAPGTAGSRCADVARYRPQSRRSGRDSAASKAAEKNGTAKLSRALAKTSQFRPFSVPISPNWVPILKADQKHPPSTLLDSLQSFFSILLKRSQGLKAADSPQSAVFFMPARTLPIIRAGQQSRAERENSVCRTHPIHRRFFRPGCASHCSA